jgi:internalin A
LEKLSLADNQVSSLSPLAGLNSLSLLFASGAAITDLGPLAGLTSLKVLNLSENEISGLAPLAGLAALENLWLSDNEISDLAPLAGLASLKEISLNHNKINDLSPLAGLTSLRHLELSHNRLADLSPLAGLTSLTWLELSHNLLADLSPLAGLTKLRILHLAGNEIKALGALAGLASLRWLELNDNRIEDLAPLAGRVSLEMLKLARNRIRDLSPLAGLSALEQLDVKSNEISVLPELPGLAARTLILEDNPLRDIRALEKISFGSVQYINLGRGRPYLETRTAPPKPSPAAAPQAGRKLLILGLDGILWGGVAAAGTVFKGRDDWLDRAFLAFQRRLKALARRGLSLAVCSFNDPHIARQPFLVHGDMPLALADFAAFKADWRRKSDNILDISRELGVPLADVVFMDYDPDKRAEVRRRLPEVAVPELPLEPWRYIPALKRGGWLKAYFEAEAPTGED